MRGLTNSGYAGLAYRGATNTTYPSWGYMIAQGATTIWELWNGNTANPAMNSGNHVMLLGDLMVWYFEDLAGIKTDAVKTGFRHIIMHPCFPDGLHEVNASYDSYYGKIKSHWKRAGDKLVWDITIPPNATATVYLPARQGKRVVEIGSGDYHFDGLFSSRYVH
jgi:alpha-L-rhamnosidase